MTDRRFTHFARKGLSKTLSLCGRCPAYSTAFPLQLIGTRKREDETLLTPDPAGQELIRGRDVQAGRAMNYGRQF